METSVHCRSTSSAIGPLASEPSAGRDVARRHGPTDPLGPPLPAAIEQGEEQGVLVGEVGVEGALGQPGPGADVRDRGRPVPLLGEELHRRVEQGGDRDRPAFRDSSWHVVDLIGF